jgi:hypothetical protein
MANELSSEDIAELERLLEVSGIGDVNDDAAYAIGALGALPSLLAMAKRLVELEGALEFLNDEWGATILTRGKDAKVKTERDLTTENAIAIAKHLGWTPDAGRGGR